MAIALKDLNVYEEAKIMVGSYNDLCKRYPGQLFALGTEGYEIITRVVNVDTGKSCTFGMIKVHEKDRDKRGTKAYIGIPLPTEINYNPKVDGWKLFIYID